MTNAGAGALFDTVLTDALLADGSRVSIGITAGRIAAIDAVLPAGREQLSVGGSLVLPGLVDAHVHLDKSLIGDAWQPHRAGRSATFSVMELSGLRISCAICEAKRPMVASRSD